MVYQGNAGDRGARGAGHLGNQQGSRTCAPCAATNPAPYARTRDLTTPSPDAQSTTTKKWKPLRMKTSQTDAKRPTRIPRP